MSASFIHRRPTEPLRLIMTATAADEKLARVRYENARAERVELSRLIADAEEREYQTWTTWVETSRAFHGEYPAEIQWGTNR